MYLRVKCCYSSPVVVVVGFDPPLHRLVEGSRSVSVAVRLFGATDVAFSVTMTSMNVDAIGQWIM